MHVHFLLPFLVKLFCLSLRITFAVYSVKCLNYYYKSQTMDNLCLGSWAIRLWIHTNLNVV